MKIAMIGAGYVGLVSGACLSEFGHHVVCYDQNRDKIERLRRNEIPIYEPSLEAVVSRNVEAGRLSFMSELAALDIERMKAALRQPIVVDLRNIYRPDEMRMAGFQYSSIGRP